MKKPYLVFAIFTAAVLMAGLFFSACNTGSSNKLKVVAGSSLLTYIAQQVGGERVEVINLIPPTQHPGDFNVRPGDIQTLSEARLFLLHGWPGEGYADDFIASANNLDLTVVKANVNGNWMIPSVQMEAAKRVAEILAEIDSQNADAYNRAADEYGKRIQAKEADVKAKLAGINASQTDVIASFRQADFLQWAGFNVVATYQDPETLTPQVVKGLVDQGRAAGVSLIIDNLQNGQNAGKGLADELGAKNINLSNFPGGLENTETWEKAIDRNVELLLKAVNDS